MKNKIRAFLLLTLTAGLTMITGCATGSGPGRPADWDKVLEADVASMGTYNWIAVVDSAYPRPPISGEDVIVTRRKHVQVLKSVVDVIRKSDHVDASVFTSLELEHIPDRDAPGIASYKRDLGSMLSGWRVAINPEKENVEIFNKAAKEHDVLILKTDMTIPYTSVFFKLDCKYWDESREKRLRNALMNAANLAP